MKSADPPSSMAMARIVDRNIHALIVQRQQEQQQRRLRERVADCIGAFTGSMLFVYLHLIGYGAWIVINLGWTPLPKFDPTFVVLAMEASVEAIFLTTFVLITQNRMTAQADRRADLDLQISLLSEHELTRVLTIVTAIAQKMQIQESDDPELQELKRDIKPEAVLERIEETEQKVRQRPVGRVNSG